jgi:hypothetical protein
VDPSLDIFGVTHRYLERDLTLDDLQEWLVPRLGAFLVDPHSTASELAGLLELCFADTAAGEADENELRDLIDDFIRTNSTIVLASPVQTGTSNAMTSIEQLFVGTPQSTFQPV